MVKLQNINYEKLIIQLILFIYIKKEGIKSVDRILPSEKESSTQSYVNQTIVSKWNENRGDNY